MMWMIYLVGTIDSVSIFFIILSVITFFLGFIFFIQSSTYSEGDTKEEDRQTRKKYLKKFQCVIPVFLIFFLIAALLPSSQTVAVMYLIPKLLQNQQLQQIPDKALALLNDKLDDWIKDAQANGK